MSINKELVKESLDREAMKKVAKGELLSETICAMVASEILYSNLEDELPPKTFIELADAVIDWLKTKQITFATVKYNF